MPTLPTRTHAGRLSVKDRGKSIHRTAPTKEHAEGNAAARAPQQAQRARALQLLHITTQEHPQIRRMWGACIALPVSKVIHAHTSARVPWRGSSYELPSHAGSGTRASRAATGNLPAHMRHCNVQVKDQRASKPEPQCVVRGQPSGLRHTYAHNRNDGCVACPVDRRFRRRRNKHGAESRSEFNVRFC